MQIRRFRLGATGLLGLTILLVAAPTLRAAQSTNTAQAKPAQPSASPAAPQPGMTTATFDDWVLGCQRAGPADKPVRVCEVGQVIRAQGRQEAVARVAIGRLNKSDPLRFATLLPPNVSFPSTVRVALSDTDPLALDLPWRRCVSGFCQADGEIHDEVLKAWRAASDQGKITFKDAAGRSVTVPLSLKGLAPALDALAKEGL